MGFVTPYLFLDLVLVLIVGVYVYFQWAFGHWKRRGVPYLEPEFPYGNVDDPFRRKRAIGLTMKLQYDKLKAKNLKYGGIYVFTKPLCMLTDPEIIKQVLSKDYDYFNDRGFYHNEKVDPLSGHIFNLSGTKWKNLRVKITPVFTSGKIKGMFDSLIQCGESLREHIQNCAENGSPIDIKRAMARYTTDVIGTCAFGIECNSFGPEESLFEKYGSRVFGSNSIRDISRLLFTFTFPTLAGALGVPLFDPEVAKFYFEIVKDTIEYRERNNITRNDFLQQLLEMQKMGKLTFEQVVAQCFVFFLGGFDTTSSTISWALYELSLNQELQERARKEVVDILERHGGKLNYENVVQEMKFLEQIINESLRKYPVVTQLHRKCTKDYTLPDTNKTIKKGERVTISLMGLHYDPELFPEPETFNPDRFSDENKHTIVPFSYLPFGDGPRICLGARFAMLQSKIGLALLLKDFKFSINEKMKLPLSFAKKSIILNADGGLWLTAKRI